METLPNELLLEIIGHLSLEGIHGLANISFVNRRLHRLANQITSNAFVLSHGNPGLFIRTLASSPTRAQCIQEVDWDCSPIGDIKELTNDAFLFPSDLTPTELQNVIQGVARGFAIGLDSREIIDLDDIDIGFLNEILAHIGTDAFLFVFLLFTRNIRTLRVVIPSVWDSNSVWFWSTLRLPTLSNLSKVTIIGPMRIRNVIPLFMLPSLRGLTLDGVAHCETLHPTSVEAFKWDKHDAVYRLLRKEKSRIESLRLQNCSNDTMKLAELIRLFRRLETLEFHFKDYGLDGKETVLEQLLRALTYHSISLTSLSLKDRRLGLIPNILTEVGKLEHTQFLVLDISEMFGFYSDLNNVTCESLSRVLQQLPRRIQHLQLIANDPEEELDLRPSAAFCDALLEIAPAIKTILPALHTLAIIEWHPFSGTFTCQTKLTAILRAFAETGVRLQSLPYDPTFRSRVDIVAREMEEEDWLWVTWDPEDHGYMYEQRSDSDYQMSV